LESAYGVDNKQDEVGATPHAELTEQIGWRSRKGYFAPLRQAQALSPDDASSVCKGRRSEHTRKSVPMDVAKAYNNSERAFSVPVLHV